MFEPSFAVVAVVWHSIFKKKQTLKASTICRLPMLPAFQMLNASLIQWSNSIIYSFMHPCAAILSCLPAVAMRRYRNVCRLYTESNIFTHRFLSVLPLEISIYHAVCPHSTHYSTLLWQIETYLTLQWKGQNQPSVWHGWYRNDLEFCYNPRIITVLKNWSEKHCYNWSKRNVSHYLCWAATGPSCTGTHHRTPAVWRTHYRSSASARTGRSWRATSFALWEETGGETDGGDTYRLELPHSPCCSILYKHTQQGRAITVPEKTRLWNLSWWMLVSRW